MVKLKTLKDIELGGHEPYDKIKKNHIRQEAIKWVKEWESKNDILEGEGYGRQYVLIMIKFFNITEEEIR